MSLVTDFGLQLYGWRAILLGVNLRTVRSTEMMSRITFSLGTYPDSRNQVRLLFGYRKI